MRTSPAGRARTITAALASSIALIGVSSGALGVSPAAASSGAGPGGTVVFALPPAVTPAYILPIMGSAYYSNVDLYQFQQIIYRPLYWFGQGASPTFNPALSLANAPVYSHGGTVLTITMKKYNWEDGQPVTSRDVLFFMNLLKAETSIWPVYVP